MSRRSRRIEKARERHRRTLLGLAVISITAGLVASAVTLRPLWEAEPVAATPAPAKHGKPCLTLSSCGLTSEVSTTPLDAWGMAATMLEQIQPYLQAVEDQRIADAARLAYNRARAYRVHLCEQGGTANPWHPNAHNGFAFFDNGMGMMSELYRRVTGRSGVNDPPEVQMDAAVYAHDVLGARWAPKCEAEW